MAEAIKVGLIGEGENDASEAQPGTLVIKQQTILKPSTDASADLPPETLENIAPGNYPVLDSRLEERHYWVKWPDKSLKGRDEHFIFEEYAEMKV
jgi:N-acetylmuramoyl-L-alanine amidase